MELSPTTITQDAMRQQEFAMLLAKASPERRAIFEKLQGKQWFQHTDFEFQKKLLTLPPQIK